MTVGNIAWSGASCSDTVPLLVRRSNVTASGVSEMLSTEMWVCFMPLVAQVRRDVLRCRLKPKP